MGENIFIAIVCSSNMNRSMEAHAFLAKKGYRVMSFGTGKNVKLPGFTPETPNCYEFGVPYEVIYNDLQKKDKEYYTQNGILHMLHRNKRIKPFPERFQASTEKFDVIITCEERVYDEVIEWFCSRKSVHNQPVHVVNIDILDNHEEATVGACMISDMVERMALSEDLDNDLDELLHDFEERSHRPILNSIMFY